MSKITSKGVTTVINKSIIILALFFISIYAMAHDDSFTLGVIVGCFCGIIKGSQ